MHKWQAHYREQDDTIEGQTDRDAEERDDAVANSLKGDLGNAE